MINVMKSTTQVVLVTVSGKDQPGITSSLTGILSESEVRILDMGQAVIHGLLSLSILFEISEATVHDNSTIKNLLFKATELGMKLEFQVLDPQTDVFPLKRKFYYALTLISENLSARTVHRVTEIMAQHRLNIDEIRKLSEETFTCIELSSSSSEQLNELDVKKDLHQIATEEKVDIALQAEGLFRRTKRLVVLDMDSTMIMGEVIDELARVHGVYDEVAEITREAMGGNLPFDESLNRRVGKLSGLKESKVDEVYRNLRLTPGAKELILSLKKLGYRIALISGGFNCIANRLREEFGLDYAYANELEFKNGECTGRVIPPIVNAQRKADLLDTICQQEKIHLDQVVAVGDGANDLLMLEKAGLGIAFNAKPIVQERADTSINQRNLHSIFYLLGISGRDLNEVLNV